MGTVRQCFRLWPRCIVFRHLKSREMCAEGVQRGRSVVCQQVRFAPAAARFAKQNLMTALLQRQAEPAQEVCIAVVPARGDRVDEPDDSHAATPRVSGRAATALLYASKYSAPMRSAEKCRARSRAETPCIATNSRLPVSSASAARQPSVSS